MRMLGYPFLVLALLATLPVLASQAAPAASATAKPTLPPLRYISHTVVRPLCSALRRNFGPAIGLVLQNDRAIAKSPALLNNYNLALAQGTLSKARRNITLLRMSNLVGPLVANIQAARAKLDDPNAFPGQANNINDQLSLKIRKDLQRAIALQSVSLDIINGFVQTQQMHQIQNEGTEYIGAINTSDVKQANGLPTPNPLYHDSQLQAGVKSDPYSMDPTMIPGLTLGYNPISRLVGVMKWTQHAAKAREQHVASDVMIATQMCAPKPRPSATP